MNKIKIGVFGGGVRGVDLTRNFLMLNCDIVAFCESRKERIGAIKEKFGNSVTVYENFDEFIEHGMDAVILANYFHEHAPYAIRCFERGIHVFSECISNGTMAEGVELVRAFEKSKSIYMLAENYPQMKFNREIKRICDGGTLGQILYAEGEYNHPSDPRDISFAKDYIYFSGHWRNYLPRTYYVTHSLGPIMWATGATPKRVTAFSVFSPVEGDMPSARYAADRVSVMMTQNDDGSVFRFTGCAAFGSHHNSYRVCGVKGSVENLRGMGGQISLRYNSWDKPEGVEHTNQIYEPSWNDRDEALIVKSGHGGADYLTARMFVSCIKEGRQPEHPFDIYSAVNMSSVAILAHRSALEGGKPYDIPDLHDEKWRRRYENDRLTPFFGKNGEAPTLPCCSHADFIPTEKQRELYEELIK